MDPRIRGRKIVVIVVVVSSLSVCGFAYAPHMWAHPAVLRRYARARPYLYRARRARTLFRISDPDRGRVGEISPGTSLRTRS